MESVWLADPEPEIERLHGAGHVVITEPDIEVRSKRRILSFHEEMQMYHLPAWLSVVIVETSSMRKPRHACQPCL